MSHYTVAVFSRDENQVDELLAPFNEDVEPGYPFAVFEEDDDYDVDAVCGKRGYWHNPDARWDWYCIGGRWAGLLKLKEECVDKYFPSNNGELRNYAGQISCDSALVEDCDFSPDQDDYNRALRFWDIVVEGKPKTAEEEKSFFGLYSGEYYVKQYGTRENYAKHQAAFLPYAFLTEDGEWHETGHMGWWGMDDATSDSRETYMEEFEAYLEEARKKGLRITIVDCHI